MMVSVVCSSSGMVGLKQTPSTVWLKQTVKLRGIKLASQPAPRHVYRIRCILLTRYRFSTVQ